MADYWKSQGRKFCDFCKCWIADNKPSIDFHEGGKKHKENVSKRLKEMHKNTAKQAKQNKKFEDDLKKMENAAMAAYLKDVENNMKDMTADRIIKEKMSKNETKTALIPNANATPQATPETIPRFKYDNPRNLPPDIDPCDPTAMSRLARTKSQHNTHSENKCQGKNKSNKGKGGKKKKIQEDDGPSKVVRKVWYEARSPEGYTYYWNIDTNESVWEPPMEGYMTFAEQEEEAKEQAIQLELLEQLEKEEAAQKADLLEEQRAMVQRERLKEYKKQRQQAASQQQTTDGDNVVDKNEETDNVTVKMEPKEEKIEIKKEPEDEEKKIIFRRDYSIQQSSHPYGDWQTIVKIERKPVDLQLPVQKQIQLPTFETVEPPIPDRSFKEKTITRISTGDSDDEGSMAVTTFKKRKIGNRNVRKRFDDD